MSLKKYFFFLSGAGIVSEISLFSRGSTPKGEGIIFIWEVVSSCAMYFLHKFRNSLFEVSQLETYEAPSQENLSCAWYKGFM